MVRIRDPIHGFIDVDRRELAILDSPLFQRLRHVRQLGFSDLAFPGATHVRYAHALGAMHVVTEILDRIHARLPDLPRGERERLRAAVRVAMLLHDLGHPPFSHASESILPPRAALGLPAWTDSGAVPGADKATHEDFTLRLLLDSDLTAVLRREYGPLDLQPEAIASLIAGREAPGGPAFRVEGIDHGPLLRQVVSSELDADRMDYLLRDSFYTGVNYGKFDLEWLSGSLACHVHDGVAELALSSRAIFAFEDFLLSRYHMFLSVYHHRTPACFDRMLRCFYADDPTGFTVPAAPEGFLDCDDVALLSALRRSGSDWARRIVRRQPYALLVEVNPYDTGYDVAGIAAELGAAGIPHLEATARSMVSKYFGRHAGDDRIWVEIAEQGRHVPLEQYTSLFRRYEAEARIDRIYVEPERLVEARRRSGLGAV